MKIGPFTWIAARPSLAATAFGLTLLAASQDGSAYMQKGGTNPPGHEFITWLGAKRAGGITAEPGKNEVTKANAACSACERGEEFRHHTKNWRTWSAIMGQRWADIGGFNAAWDVAKKKVGGEDCFHAVAQDSDFAQHIHALRRVRKGSPESLQCAHLGLVRTIRWWFMAGVKAGDIAIWFTDGGAIRESFKAKKPYFYFGIALHALEDSFSTEHTRRTNDFKEIKDIKVYVDSKAATPTTHDPEPRGPLPGMFAPDHGDNPYVGGGYKMKLGAVVPTYRESKLKESARTAIRAVADFFQAFEKARQKARNDPSAPTALFETFRKKWLRLVRVPGANPVNEAECGFDSYHAEPEEESCLKKWGRNPHPLLANHYPPFCIKDCPLTLNETEDDPPPRDDQKVDIGPFPGEAEPYRTRGSPHKLKCDTQLLKDTPEFRKDQNKKNRKWLGQLDRKWTVIPIADERGAFCRVRSSRLRTGKSMVKDGVFEGYTQCACIESKPADSPATKKTQKKKTQKKKKKKKLKRKKASAPAAGLYVTNLNGAPERKFFLGDEPPKTLQGEQLGPKVGIEVFDQPRRTRSGSNFSWCKVRYKGRDGWMIRGALAKPCK